MQQRRCFSSQHFTLDGTTPTTRLKASIYVKSSSYSHARLQDQAAEVYLTHQQVGLQAFAVGVVAAAAL
jgi:hypothetical protein